MKDSKLLATSAVASLLALGLGLASNAALAAKGDFEKCAGIVKAGMNDCQTASSACAGTSKVDGQKDAWVYLPKGTCEKIVGGHRVQAAK